MSLTLEQWKRASLEWDEMDVRLKRLIGFNPTTCNHYGIIQLYNHRIDSSTSDETILKLREAYKKWRSDILALLAEHEIYPDDDQFDRLFMADSMYGRIQFLGFDLNIFKPAEIYRDAIENYLEGHGIGQEHEEYYIEMLRGI